MLLAFFHEVVAVVGAVWVLKTLPGFLMIMLSGIMAAVMMWKHRSSKSKYRFNLRYIQDIVLTGITLIMFLLGIVILLGWLEVG